MLPAVRAGETLSTGPSGIPVRSLRAEVVEGPDTGKIALSRGETLSVGTGENNDLLLTDPTVSRYHADLIGHERGVLVIDQGSTNGSVVSGVRVERAVVPSRSTIKLGRTLIRVDDGDPATVEAFEGDELGPIVGRAPAMRRLMAQIERAARSDTSLLLFGETGTGKEVVARAIHEASTRKNGPLETVDCGSLLPTLVASELFGHEKGAFTGADHQHIGAFERAAQGTVFLDEIGELPPNLQTALLGVIERKSFRRVGGTQAIAADVRVISATHRDLRREVNAGTFRQDLYYRLAVVTLAVPPLRERLEDVPLLIEHFLRLLGHSEPMEALLPALTLEHLRAHRWPGNVRELRNVVEASLVMGEAPTLDEAPLGPRSEAPGSPPSAAPPAPAPGGPNLVDLSTVLGLPYSEARDQIVDRFEAVYLADLLHRYRGNVTLAAREAKMNRTYLTRVMKRRGLERP
jgi:DNA-binding NtrC family response regulator